MTIESPKPSRESSEKLYVQLASIMRKKIEDREWLVDSQIPTEEDLCKIYGVSKATVRLAVSELVKQGYLMRKQGKGTFVCKRVIPEGLTMSTSFRELMVEAGVRLETEVLAQTVTMPVDEVDMKLDIADDMHLIYIKRLRRLDGEPVLLQEAFIPHSLCPGLLRDDIESNSLLELLEKKYGLTITKARDYIGITHLGAEEGRLFGMDEGSPGLLHEQHFYSGDVQIMYMRSVKRPERFRFYLEFERKTA